MKLLITGATGLVGSILAQKALSLGHEIHFLTTRKTKVIQEGKMKGYYWNPSLNELDLACFEGVDAIVHLAGASISQRWTKKNKEEISLSRINGTRLLVDGIRQLDGKHQIKQVVAASAIGIYPSSFEMIYTEDYLPKRSSFLEEVVMDWEQEEDGFSSVGLQLAKLRIGLVLTETGGVLGPLKIPTWFGLGAAFGNGEQTQSWIHVDDLVGMIMTAIDKKWEGVFNAVSPNPVSQKEFSKTLAKAMRRIYFLPPIPKLFIRLVVGEMSTLVFNSQNVSAEKALKEGFVFIHPELLPAIKSLL